MDVDPAASMRIWAVELDLGGHTHTHEFTDEVIRHVKTKLEVWSALA